jgi:hypothetical protein
MTVYEASGKLYIWFSLKDSFSMEEDFLGLIKISEDPERDKECIKCALKDLESGGLVKSAGGEIWILSRPFESYEQNLEITADICLAMAEIINAFCDTIDNEEEKCNPSSIKISDLKNLIYIANHLMEEKRVDLNGEME